MSTSLLSSQPDTNRLFIPGESNGPNGGFRFVMHIVITSGPTREPLDPVRFISNRSSGRMGAALAQACLCRNCRVTIVSGAVTVPYPIGADVVWVETTAEMLDAARGAFASADGLIGAAAPCDFRPRRVAPQKIAKGSDNISIELTQTPDIISTLALEKGNRWIVGFALETHDHHENGLAKLRRKGCDWIVINDARVLNSSTTHITMLDRLGQEVLTADGDKMAVAEKIVATVLGPTRSADSTSS